MNKKKLIKHWSWWAISRNSLQYLAIINVHSPLNYVFIVEKQMVLTVDPSQYHQALYCMQTTTISCLAELRIMVLPKVQIVMRRGDLALSCRGESHAVLCLSCQQCESHPAPKES